MTPHEDGKPRLRWSCLISAFDIGYHWNCYANDVYAGRVFAAHHLERLPVLPYPSGRRRYLYFAILAGESRPAGVVGVFKSLRSAQKAVERALHAEGGGRPRITRGDWDG